MRHGSPHRAQAVCAVERNCRVRPEEIPIQSDVGTRESADAFTTRVRPAVQVRKKQSRRGCGSRGRISPRRAQQGQSYKEQSILAETSGQKSLAVKVNDSIHRFTPFLLSDALMVRSAFGSDVRSNNLTSIYLPHSQLRLADTPASSESILAALKVCWLLTQRTEFEQVVTLYVGIARTAQPEDTSDREF